MTTTSTTSENVVIKHSNESPYPILYGQNRCPICNGRINTGFRCLSCGQQFSPPRGWDVTRITDGWEDNHAK